MPLTLSKEQLDAQIELIKQTTGLNPLSPNAIGEYLRIVVQFLDERAKLSEEFVTETNSSTFIQQSLATIEGYKTNAFNSANSANINKVATDAALQSAVQEKTAAQVARSAAETAANRAELGLIPKGSWHAVNNIPAITVTPNPAWIDGSYLDISPVSGVLPFAGENFISGQVVNPGDRIKKIGTLWSYIKNSTLGLEHSLNAEMLSVRQGLIENMITQSESMSTFSASLATTEVSAVGPDGISGSLKIIESASNGIHRLSSANLSIVTGKSYTTAIAIAKGTRSQAKIELGGVSHYEGGQVSLYVNLDSGTLFGQSASVKKSGIIQLDNNFFLVWVTVKAVLTAQSSLRIDCYNGSTNSYLGDGSYIFVAKPQFSQTEALIPYTPTGSVASEKSLALPVNPNERADWNRRVRTQELDSKSSITSGNMILYSENPSLGWTLSGILPFVPAIGSDDVTLNAYNVIENNTNTEHAIKSNALNFIAGSTYWVSVDLKLIAGNKSAVIVLGGFTFGAGLDSAMFINIATKTISGGVVWADRGIIDLGNGWIRVWAKTNVVTATGYSQLRIYSGVNFAVLGDGTSGFYVSRCQIIDSNVFPRYIKTLGAPIPKTVFSPVTDTEKAEWNGKATIGDVDARVTSFSEANMRLVMPGRLYLIDGKPLPIYRKSIVSSLTGLNTFSLALMERDNANNNIPANRYFDEHILVDSAVLLPSVEMVMIPKVSNNNIYRRPLIITKRTAASVAGLTVKINHLGDSLSQWGVISRTKLYLERLGITPTMIGTLDTTAPIVKGEGRGGWSFKRFVGASSRMSDGTVITVGATGLFTNPFLKVATVDDKANHPDWCFRSSGAETELSYITDPDKTGNFYIFDYAYYLSSNTLATPDVVNIALSTNDINHYGQVAGTQWSVFGLDIIVRQIKTAHPNMKIIVVPAPVRGYGSVGNPQWLNHFEWMERSQGIVAGYQATFGNMHLCGVWAHMSRELDFTFNAGVAITANNPTLVSQISDQTHFDNSGTCEFTNALSMCIANII